MKGGARILLPLAGLAVLALALWGMDAFDPRAPEKVGESARGESEQSKAPSLLGATNPEAPPLTAADGAATEEQGEPTYAIIGRVIDAEHGTPVPGVAVFVFPEPWGIHRFQFTARTVSGPDGSYRVAGLRPEDSDQCVVAMGAGWVSSELATESRVSRAALPTAEAVAGDTYRLDLHVVRAARLEGRVFLPDGTPAVGAEVRGLLRTVPHGLMMVRSFTFEDLIEVVRTDADGRFVIPSVSASNALRVEARLSGYVWTLSPPVETALGHSSSVEIHLRAPRRAMLHVVSARDGSPVDGATVRTHRIRNRQERREWPFEDSTDLVRVTNAQGRADLSPLPAGPLWLSVTARAYQRYTSPRDVDAFEEVFESAEGSAHDPAATIRLEPAGEVAGRIIPPDGVSVLVFHVQVRALDAPGHERVSRFELVEGEDGTFRVELPLTGLYRLEAGGSFEGKLYGAVMEVRPGDVDLEIRVAVEGIDPLLGGPAPEPEGPVGWWDVEVVGPDGRLVKRVWLSVLPPDSESDLYGDEESPLLPYTEGRYRIPVRPETRGVWLEADFVMLADGTTGAPRRVGPLDGAGGKMTLRLERAGSISGVVLGTDGKPLQGQRVVAVQADPGGPPEADYYSTDFSADARTDADGRFTVHGLANAEHMLWLRPQKGLVPEAPVRVRTGQTDVVLRTKPPLGVTVTVRDESGAPVAGVDVSAAIHEELIDIGEEHSSAAVTDAQGRCRLGGLDDAANYNLHVRAGSERKDLAWGRIEAWRPANTTVVLARLYSLSGRVQTPAGEPIEGALVTLQVEGQRPERMRSETGGTFTFEGLKAGAGRLCATWHESSRDGTLLGPASEERTVRMGEQDIVLRLAPGRDLSVHIQNVSSRWGLGRRVRVSPIDEPKGVRTWLKVDAQGKVLCRGLEPGRGYYVWFGPTEFGRYAYGMAAPEQTSITLAAQQGGEVNVRVTWPDGAAPDEVYLSGPGFYIRAERKDDGVYSIRGVPPGRWRVTVRAQLAGQTLSAEHEAAAGESIEVQVTAR